MLSSCAALRKFYKNYIKKYLKKYLFDSFILKENFVQELISNIVTYTFIFLGVNRTLRNIGFY